MITGKRIVCIAVLFALAQVSSLAWAWGDEDPVVDNSRTTQKLRSLNRNDDRPKPVATIYEFRSSVPEVSGRAATDMFTTALIKSGAVTVVERQRLNQGVMRERELNGRGLTTGDAANQKLVGAQVIFEGTVSEANKGESKTSGGVTVGGMDVGGGVNKDTVGLDVRIIDAQTGVVLDAVNVRKDIDSGGAGVAGVGRLAQSIARLNGKSIPLNPDARVKTSRKEGVDKALRSCIEAAVYEILQRM
jgi:curli biogenesis system outer membrane secretion channel CsgG